jgi:hypothetical protein
MKYAVLFIALLFAGCGGGYETFTVAGETIQVAKEDSPLKMNYYNAMSSCEELGNGWRLPDKDELTAMYEQLHKQGKGNFKDDWYWSSSQFEMGCAWGMSFGSGNVSGDNKDVSNKVRAVRAKP